MVPASTGTCRDSSFCRLPGSSATAGAVVDSPRFWRNACRSKLATDTVDISTSGWPTNCTGTPARR